MNEKKVEKSRHTLSLFIVGMLAVFSSNSSLLADVKVGSAAPEFQCKDDSGKLWKASEHVGKGYLVVYFYPAAMTGGCTKQACSFRDDRSQLNKDGIEVVGISGDEPAGLALFKLAHKLNFTLLSDPDGTIARKFGVPVRAGGSIKRTINGKEHVLKRGVTTARWTFIIDPDGNVVFKNTKVNAAEDSKNILAKINELKGSK